MKLKELLKSYEEVKLEEMAMRHLEDTQDLWDKNDLEGVANKYIENALKDNLSYTHILKGLSATFRSKGFDHNRKNVDKVKELIKNKIKGFQTKTKENEKALKVVKLIKKEK